MVFAQASMYLRDTNYQPDLKKLERIMHQTAPEVKFLEQDTRRRRGDTREAGTYFLLSDFIKGVQLRHELRNPKKSIIDNILFFDILPLYQESTPAFNAYTISCRTVLETDGAVDDLQRTLIAPNVLRYSLIGELGEQSEEVITPQTKTLHKKLDDIGLLRSINGMLYAHS